MFLRSAKFGFALAALLITMPALAQEMCGPADKVVPGLTERYQERLVFEGQGGTSFVVSLFVNQTTGSWTILTVNRKSNLACVAAGGMKSRVLEALHAGEPT